MGGSNSLAAVARSVCFRRASRISERVPTQHLPVKIFAVLLVLLNAALLLPAAPDTTRILAFACVAVALTLAALLFKGGSAAVAPAVAEAVKPAPAAAPQNQAQAEVVTLMAVFQEKGRLVDFLMEDIAPYDDAQVGAVARAVHEGCKAALNEHFQIEPVSAVEGESITVPAGHPADEYRLVGNLSGGAPFSGKVVHKGWRTTSVKLPRVLNPDEKRLPVIAPAQVEVS